ncbi:hypothetical protein JAAARDRAFT_48449 [Jaapia argillacea MUCL 33604]|uniref:Uncharacterized protein n=1 Tax=Jaapia argillacea MUCL 33604 TaxID=933084 RepID=A0A067Q0F9_9AGAM|nr:hypothetical protein JAAARDRAFT_48449 [Jaapia argillacea MUCL 33604]
MPRTKLRSLNQQTTLLTARTARWLGKENQAVLSLPRNIHPLKTRHSRQQLRTSSEKHGRTLPIPEVLSFLRAENLALKEKLRLMGKKATWVRERAVERARRAALKESRKFQLKDKGVYVAETRALRKVRKVLKLVGKAMGMSVDKEISRRTVGRIVLEGGIAAEMQIGYEVSQVKGLAVNGDGTMIRQVNQESHHLVYRAPSYSDEPSQHWCRFIGVDSAPDHTSKTQMEGWVKKFDGIAAVFSNSPLAKRMSGDHASDLGCTAHHMHGLKDESVLQVLGEQVLSLRPPQNLVLRVAEGLCQKMVEVGGEEAWNALAIEKQTEHELSVISSLTKVLGHDELAQLSPAERRIYEMFLKVGCCMHKDLNTVRYGALVMMLWWAAHGVPGPTLLPNKDNAAILAGAIFNNKDEKKGQHDMYISWFKHHLGHVARFPDTSNTRFQTHCTAAAELILHLELYLEFLLHIRDKKDSMTWTNMEENLFQALQDIPTLTKLAILALYAETISHPYMRVVRTPGVEQANILDLRPFHTKVKTYTQTLIHHPNLILAQDASHQTGSLDGQPWEHPDVIESIHRCAAGLPYLEPVFVAFMEGTAKGWEHFTLEFRDDGPITNLSVADKDVAWMPATNNINEGSLGWKRVISRQKPVQTAHQQNAMGMYILEDEDQGYIIQAARKRDESGLEQRRLVELAEAHQREVEANRMKKAEQERKMAKKLKKLEAVTLILNISKLHGINCTRLDEQLNVYCQIDEIVQKQKKKDRKTKAVKLLALEGAITQYKAVLAELGIDTSCLTQWSNPLRTQSGAMATPRQAQESWADNLDSEEE